MLFNKEVELFFNSCVIMCAFFRYEGKTMRGPLYLATLKQVIEPTPNDGGQTTVD